MRSRRLLATLVLIVAGVCAFAPSAGAAADVVAGACLFEEIEVRFTGPALASTPSSTTTVEFAAGSALCATSGGLGVGAIRATASPTLPGGLSCLAGTAHGSGMFDVGPQFGEAFPIEVSMVNVGGVWTVVLASGLSLLGVGVFAQPPLDTAACVTGSLASTTWTGTVVFEDPTLPSGPR